MSANQTTDPQAAVLGALGAMRDAVADQQEADANTAAAKLMMAFVAFTQPLPPALHDRLADHLNGVNNAAAVDPSMGPRERLGMLFGNAGAMPAAPMMLGASNGSEPEEAKSTPVRGFTADDENTLKRFEGVPLEMRFWLANIANDLSHLSGLELRNRQRAIEGVIDDNTQVNQNGELVELVDLRRTVADREDELKKVRSELTEARRPAQGGRGDRDGAAANQAELQRVRDQLASMTAARDTATETASRHEAEAQRLRQELEAARSGVSNSDQELLDVVRAHIEEVYKIFNWAPRKNEELNTREKTLELLKKLAGHIANPDNGLGLYRGQLSAAEDKLTVAKSVFDALSAEIDQLTGGLFKTESDQVEAVKEKRDELAEKLK